MTNIFFSVVERANNQKNFFSLLFFKYPHTRHTRESGYLNNISSKEKPRFPIKTFGKDAVDGLKLFFHQNKFIYRTIIFLFAFTILLASSGCFILRPAAGASYDKEQVQKAREAKMMEVKLQAAQRLQTRLADNKPIENSDFTFYFNQELFNKAAAQLDGTIGWLDSLNSYFIRSIRVTLNNGSAVATFNLAVFNHQHNVNVDMLMDCLLDFSVENGKLYARFEPFSISPVVSASGVAGILNDIIADIIELKISEMSQKFPPIEMPIDFENKFPIPQNSLSVRSGINMDISIPGATLAYGLQVKEILIFHNAVVVGMNLTKASKESAEK